MTRRPLILSALAHDIHADAMCWVLRRHGIDPLWIRSWADPALAPLSLRCDPTHGVRGEGGPSADDIASVWFRRPRAPEAFPQALPADLPFLRNEWSRFANNLHAVAADATRALWVNDPAAAINAENKLIQLRAAHRCGIAFPDTLISTDPAEIRRFAARHGRIVYKPFQTHSWRDRDGKMYSTYARVVAPEMLGDDASLRQCPGIYQAAVDKRCDIRVTVIGGRLFPVRLDAAPGGDFVDWRIASLANTLQAEPIALPPDYTERLSALMSELGIVFGCIDLVLDADDTPVFLEINQAGQFLFLEKALPELPLLRAMAAMLAEGRTDYSLDTVPDGRYADYLASDEHRVWWDSVRDGIRGDDGAIPGVSEE